MLRDRFGREHTYLRIAVTDRCNLRCTYCTPAAGVARRPPAEILSDEEILRAARVFLSLGIRKIRLTGGEPTAREGIEGLVAGLAALPGIETLGMTTNGLLLRRKAHALRQAGLAALNVSLDTLRPERFARIAGRDGLDQVMAGIEAALAAGFAPLKLNVVVMGGVNDDEVPDFAALAEQWPIHVRFIEYMPFRGNGWQDTRLVPYRRMLSALGAHYAPAPTPGAGVARSYRIEGFAGTVSFITPMSDGFCRACTRLRLTADGALKSCLFFPAEGSLRGLLREGAPDEALADAIRGVVRQKREGHPPAAELCRLADRSMGEIGG